MQVSLYEAVAVRQIAKKYEHSGTGTAPSFNFEEKANEFVNEIRHRVLEEGSLAPDVAIDLLCESGVAPAIAETLVMSISQPPT